MMPVELAALITVVAFTLGLVAGAGLVLRLPEDR